MTDIVDSRNLIQQEETRFRSPLSENLLNRVGASINHIINRQRLAYTYEYAGPFRPNNEGIGGILGFTNDAEVVGISGRLSSNGASGSTVLDLHLEQGGVDQGSVWSTPLTIVGGSPAVTYFSQDLVSASFDKSSSVTLPVFSQINFNQHDQLILHVDSNAVSALNLYLNIWFRPR